MNTETDTLVAVLNDRMKDMSQPERVALRDRLMQGYCEHCARAVPEGDTCHCWNDE